MTQNRRLGVLISGRGSNLQAIIDAIAAKSLDAELGIVISNVPDAAGLERAKKAQVETMVLDHRDKSRFATRDDYDRELARQLKSRGVGLVCLAGFMRVLTQTFLSEFPQRGRQHPSVAPSCLSRNECTISSMATRREMDGRDGPSRHRGARRRPDRVAGTGAGDGQRRCRDARGANSGIRASLIPDRDSAPAGWRMAHRRPPSR